jgi:hypothetical protein
MGEGYWLGKAPGQWSQPLIPSVVRRLPDIWIITEGASMNEGH